jgi:hypothetical protein
MRGLGVAAHLQAEVMNERPDCSKTGRVFDIGKSLNGGLLPT